ncbi:hypothetical protein QFZ35_003868 [Arthrobacter ulcerisalmonis]|nr:hypothetical protein [Arthrobacter ulcerisalmonis]MDQ0665370.1 hypothetical protein [Arthrobacter ulcerisalmonis]
MTYHLASLRLRSLGERSARFTDYTISTTGETGSPQDHIVWLRNGGGKSSLLSLFYALVLPRKLDFMGRSSDRHLTDYVESGDTSHTVAVWHPATVNPSTLDGTPERVLVTGAVYEWDDLRRPANAFRNSDHLGQSYYAFFAVPGVFDATTLPLGDAAGRPTRRSDFISQIRGLAAQHARTEFITTESYGDWERALTARGLDPDLFRSQKKMNHVEGGVENLFSFTSPKDFINFLLGLTVSPTVISDIATSVGQISEKVARKPATLADRDFCLTAADGLEQLAAAHTDQQTVATEVQSAMRDASELSARFTATVGYAVDRRAALGVERAELTADRSRHNSDRSVLNDTAFLYRVMAGTLRLEEAHHGLLLAEKTLTQARRNVEVWRAVGPLAEHKDVMEQLAEAQASAATEALELAPLAENHDNHAAAYKTLLGVLAEAAADRAATARTEILTAEADEDQAIKLADIARSHVEEASAAAARWEVQLDRYNQELRNAVEQGLLPAIQTDLVQHSRALAADQERLRVDLADVRARREARPDERNRLVGVAIGLERDQVQVDNDLIELRNEYDASVETANRLATTPRVVALVQPSTEAPVDVWADGGILLRALERETRRADAEVVGAKVAQADTTRILTVHTETGYLPSTLDVDRLTGILADAGIPAESGWAHLRSLLSHDRLSAALTHPVLAQIGSGVVVPTDQAEAASNTLDAAGETTVALVSVFTATTVGEAVDVFEKHLVGVVASNWTGLAPGLVNGAAAESEAAALEAASRDHDARTTKMIASRRDDQALHDQISAFLNACPAGRLETLTNQINALEGQLSALVERIEANKKADRDLAAAEAEDAATGSVLTDQIHELGQNLILLEKLIRDSAHKIEWKEGLAAAESQRSTSLEEAKRRQAEAKAAAARAHSLDKEAVGQERSGREYREKANQVTFIGAPTNSVTAADVVGGDLETLLRRTSDARRDYDIPANEYRAMAKVEVLSQRLAEISANLPSDPDICAEAETALTTTGGQSRQNRNDSLADAESTRSEAEQARGRAEAAVTQAELALSEIQSRRVDPPRRTIPIEPISAAHAIELAEEQEAQSARLLESINRVEEALRNIEEQDVDLVNIVAQFDLLAGNLPAPASDCPADPFPGDVYAAKRAVAGVLSACQHADERAVAAETRMADLTGALRIIATRHQDVPVKARDRILYDTAPVLASNARSLAGNLWLRAEHLAGDLASIAADQAIVTEALAAAVADIFTMIHRTQRFSGIPEGLGVLSGKQLLKIKFIGATDAELRAHVNHVLEEFINKGSKPDGMELLKAATHAAVGARGFTVKVLKPVHDLTPIEENIDALGKWSGGERLTAGVALYCTIAKIRAVSSGYKERLGGMLILDNPIGRASHGPLIDLQRKVAAAQGVQLIYATGVKDFDAVSHFPGVTRLENRAGKTGARRYIREMEYDANEAISGTRIVHSERPDRPTIET